MSSGIFFFSFQSAVDGEGAARYIKNTNSKNTNTPIIAVSAYSGVDANDGGNLFTASLSKPLQKADLLGSFPSFCCQCHQRLTSTVSCHAEAGVQNIDDARR